MMRVFLLFVTRESVFQHLYPFEHEPIFSLFVSDTFAHTISEKGSQR